MRSDAQEVLHDQKSSFLDLFEKQSGQKQKGQSPLKPPTSSGLKAKRILKKTLMSILVLVIVGGGGYGAYTFLQEKRDAAIPRDPNIPRPWLTNFDTESITVEPDDRTGLLNALDKQARSDEFLYTPIIIKDFNIKTRLAGPEEFFSFLQISPPQDFFQSLTGRWNLYAAKEGLVFIFETGDGLQTWGSMLGWERTIAQDLRQFVTNDDISKFRDRVIKNNDARVRQFFNVQRDFLGYSLILRRFLILSTSESALEEVVERMLALPIAQ